jgi:ribosomal protein S19E (S16A)
MMASIKCAWCGKFFEKAQKRINQTEKLGKQHTCNRSCASKLTNEERRCEPTTTNAANTRRDKEKFPEKDRARYLVRQAIKTDKLIPLKECEVCYEDKKVEGHHPDHSRPFFLLYLCKDCHHDADASPNKWEDLATDYSGCIT